MSEGEAAPAGPDAARLRETGRRCVYALNIAKSRIVTCRTVKHRLQKWSDHYGSEVERLMTSFPAVAMEKADSGSTSAKRTLLRLTKRLESFREALVIHRAQLEAAARLCDACEGTGGAELVAVALASRNFPTGHLTIPAHAVHHGRSQIICRATMKRLQRNWVLKVCC